MINPNYPVQVEGWPGLVQLEDVFHPIVPQRVMEGSRRLTERGLRNLEEPIVVTEDELWAA